MDEFKPIWAVQIQGGLGQVDYWGWRFIDREKQHHFLLRLRDEQEMRQLLLSGCLVEALRRAYGKIEAADWHQGRHLVGILIALPLDQSEAESEPHCLGKVIEECLTLINAQ